jgi:hypothetical protein
VSQPPQWGARTRFTRLSATACKRFLAYIGGNFAQQWGSCIEPALCVADKRTPYHVDSKGNQSGTNTDFPRFRKAPTPFAAASTPFSTTTWPRTKVVIGHPVTSIPSYGV